MKQNNRYLYFAIGVVIGISIGASVVWWMQNYDFKIWFTFSGKNDSKTEYAENLSNTSNNDNDKQTSVSAKTEKNKKNINSAIQSDSITNSKYTDNKNNDSTASSSNYNEDNQDIVIAKDELLFSRNMKIEGFVQNNGKENNLDSLLINDKTKNANSNIIKVEFWRSPINYKGYKFINNKLILFGIYNYDEAILEYHSNKIYLFYQNTYYFIEKNTDFQALIPVKLQKNITNLKK